MKPEDMTDEEFERVLDLCWQAAMVDALEELAIETLATLPCSPTIH